MGEIYKIRTAKIVAYIGITLIVIGLLLQINSLIKENKKQQELIDTKETQIKAIKTELEDCREQLKETYIKYLYLEEENMVLWSMYYSGVSEYNGDYQYYE